MSDTVYTFADGARLQPGAKADPQVVGEHLELLRAQSGGELTPVAVIDDARNDNSPLHRLFEWDDTEAARQHRLWQARHLIGSVVVRLVGGQGEPPKLTRAFVNLRVEEGQFYTSIRAAMADPDQRAIVLADALRDLQRIERKYGDLEELAALFAELAKVEVAKPRRRRKAA